jgi:sugar/nucleoside kinase (ribokinase family)
MRVLVVGSLSLDRIELDGQSEARVGGTVVYSGLTWRRLGGEVTVVTAMADRDRAAARPLLHAGVLLVAADSDATTSFVNRVDGDGREQEVAARARAIPAELVAAAGPADVVHLGPLHPDDLEPEVYRVARAAAPAVAIDVQGFTRRIEGRRVLAEASKSAAELLRGAGWLKGDAGEFDLVAAALGCSAAQLADALGAGEVLRSRASEGGEVLRPGAPAIRWAAVPVTGPVDPTGAGDVFLAAYLWHRVGQRLGIAESAALAAALAARQVAGDWIRPEELRFN